jgi:hypothetical protein|tara:strand:- start:92 stop:361 length:270 start_codon:yes stop_codon:yes gene_type:complete
LENYIQKPYQSSSQSYYGVWKLSFYILQHDLFLCVILAYHAKVLAEAARIGYTSQHVMKLERFEVGAYAVSDRLIAGITGFLGGGVHQI